MQREKETELRLQRDELEAKTRELERVNGDLRYEVDAQRLAAVQETAQQAEAQVEEIRKRLHAHEGTIVDLENKLKLKDREIEFAASREAAMKTEREQALARLAEAEQLIKRLQWEREDHKHMVDTR
jgi:ABC-type Fe3+-citrate transport system substrate-binding protein